MEHVKDKLAKAYFEKFLVRVEVLPEYQKRKSYSDVIRESQEALELFLKALLRTMGQEPSHSHDPSKELLSNASQLPDIFKPHLEELARWSKLLRKDRELSYYGAADFVPTENYSKEEGAEVIKFLEIIAKKLKSWKN